MVDTPKGERLLAQMPRFVRTKKKLPAKVQVAVDDAIREIAKEPFVGEAKMEPLAGMRVYKFKVGPQLMLLAYRFDPKANTIEAWAVGPHENFYKDLQNYRESR